MTKITLRSDFDVELVKSAGSDEFICRAARVSTLGGESINTDESYGLIRFLLTNRHGSPFEHSFMSFRISAPIFVWREFMRHRIGISYNEESGRYKQLDPVFYIPGDSRDVVQVGKAASYELVPGDQSQKDLVSDALYGAYEDAWCAYETQLECGIAKEVARMCLPVAIYSTAYVTMNPRSMMNFLGLRTRRPFPEATFPSKPMAEINKVADQMETIFQDLFPLTHKAFTAAGRVAP